MNKLIIRTISVIFISVIAFAVTSCSDDSDNKTSASSKLVGKWVNNEEGIYVIEFKSDNTGIDHAWGSSFTYTFNTGTGLLTVKMDGEKMCAHIIFIDDNTIKMSEWDDPEYIDNIYGKYHIYTRQ